LLIHATGVICLRMANEPAKACPGGFPKAVLFSVFVLSGISALIYQMVWQRALLTIYGSNVESVAMVVAAFLTGLGIGSLVGGWISKAARWPLVVLFAVIELGIGGYGLVSLRLFHWFGGLTADIDPWRVGMMAFVLIFVPTLLMGSTLPLLVAHQVRAIKHVGGAVSALYFVNTLGGALGAFLAVYVVLGSLGMSGAVNLAAVLNGAAAVVVLATWMAGRDDAC
jgi:predicted membrane-bound spermidine synthase